jgi:hypothetical protein
VHCLVTIKTSILAAADPFVSCHRVTENDNSAIDAVAKRFSDIAGHRRTGLDTENIGLRLRHLVQHFDGSGRTDKRTGAATVIDDQGGQGEGQGTAKVLDRFRRALRGRGGGREDQEEEVIHPGKKRR